MYTVEIPAGTSSSLLTYVSLEMRMEPALRSSIIAFCSTSGEIAAGQQRTESHTLTLRADSWTGLWEVGFRLDTEVVLAESVTVNNTTAVRPKFKLTATRPDLTFARGSESVYSGYQPRVCPAAYGTRLYLGFDIKNDSLAAAPASKTCIDGLPDVMAHAPRSSG